MSDQPSQSTPGGRPISILFVDDEQNILTGLQRMLRPMRGAWTMRFAGSGKEALALMQDAPADVVVSDMKMPEMDGRELLDAIEQRHPKTVRVMLSGQCEDEAAIRAAGKMHIFLAKPCHVDHLIDAIARACRLRAMTERVRFAKAFSELSALPSPSPLYRELTAALGTGGATIQDLTEIIERDAGVRANLLELLNQAQLGGGYPIASVLVAFQTIGIEIILAFLLEVDIATQLGVPGCEREIIEHSIVAASVARRLAGVLGLAKHDAALAFSAALLHDVGCLVLARSHPDRYPEIKARARADTRSRCELERRELGATHAEIGAYLLTLWGLPDAVIEAVAYHHEPAESGVKADSIVGVVHVASALADRKAGYELEIDRDYLAAGGTLRRIEGLVADAAPEPTA